MLRTVTSGRQMIDTWGAEESQSPSTIGPMAGGQTISKPASKPFVVHGTKDGLT